MKTLAQMFLDHPASVGETYLEHLASAGRFGGRMLLAGIACLLHGVFPFLCVTTGSKIVRQMHETMIAHRSHKPAAPELSDLGAHI